LNDDHDKLKINHENLKSELDDKLCIIKELENKNQIGENMFNDIKFEKTKLEHEYAIALKDLNEMKISYFNEGDTEKCEEKIDEIKT